MKQILLIAISFVVLSLVTHARAAETGTAMKLEGTCTGNLADGTTVSLNYYSDYNGCKDVSKSAVTFTSGIEGLFTGERSLGNKDVYTYPQHRLTFANSTGNTEGTLLYTDAQGARQSVKLLCDVRDYEYAEAC
jgi:hypothetical protein